MQPEPITLVEIDLETCALRFGEGACPASLGPGKPRKCYNSYATCSARPAFVKVLRRLRYGEPRQNLPRGATIYPVLESVSTQSATVNIAGSDERLSALGRRASIKVQLRDLVDHDRFLDPYQGERISGAAQIDEPGYDPAGRGSHFSRLRARWPYYAGRPLRLRQGYLRDGAIVAETIRHFVITEMTGPDSGGRVTIEASDILDLVSDKKAVAPRASVGQLAEDMTAESLVVDLSPVGVGDASYPAAGWATIGSEVVEFTRLGDQLSLQSRGALGSRVSGHSQGDTVQLGLRIVNARIDDVIFRLITEFTAVPAAFIPFTKWQAEVSRWMPQLRLDAYIAKPEGVAKLLGELAVLGISLWWDEVAQEFGLKANRPVDGEATYTITDDNALISLAIEDRDADRLTQVHFYTVTLDPTKSASATENFARATVTVDFGAQSALEYGDTRMKTILCRWLNHGADSDARILSKRLLNRFRLAPVRYRAVLDARFAALALTDVIYLRSHLVTDETGRPITLPLQVISRSEPEPGHQIEILAQSYAYAGRYGYATEDSRPAYGASTAAERRRGEYAVDDASLAFPDGTGPYLAI